MKKKNKKKSIKKDEFRYNKANKHPAYIFARIGHDFKYLGITHSPITEGMENIELSVNPNKKDKHKAYIRKVPGQQRSNRFGPKEKEMQLANKDKVKIRDFLK